MVGVTQGVGETLLYWCLVCKRVWPVAAAAGECPHPQTEADWQAAFQAAKQRAIGLLKARIEALEKIEIPPWEQ
jgi:hypothetical protein